MSAGVSMIGAVAGVPGILNDCRWPQGLASDVDALSIAFRGIFWLASALVYSSTRTAPRRSEKTARRGVKAKTMPVRKLTDSARPCNVGRFTLYE